MSNRAADVLAEVLQWPADERAELAARLLDSLDPDADDGADAAWAEEIKARLEEVRSGQVKPIPWAEVRERLRDDAGGDPG
jgi:putative addiction module component (TIGR02574 family)